MKNNFKIAILLFGIILCFSSCNAVKYVPDSDYLLTSNTILVNDKKNSDSEITDYIVQRPNQLVLGIPLPLHFYNIGNKDFVAEYDQWKTENPNWYSFTKSVFSDKKTRRMRNFKYKTHQWWLKNGEPPVIFDSDKADFTVNSLVQHYYNLGYFKAQGRFEEDIRKSKKLAVNYHIQTDKPYILDSITTNIESPVLDSIYKLKASESQVKTGDQYDLSNFANEQDRLNNLFRNSGVYRFNKNTISFEASVSDSSYTTDIEMFINDSIANFPYKIQKINAINIVTDYSFNTKDDRITDSIMYNGYHFKAHEPMKYNPKYLLNSIFIEPGDIYRDDQRELTRKHLRGLKNFRTVDIKYEELDNDLLEATINLSPLKKYSIGFNTELTHSNIRQLGISGKLSFLNRNIFKGAEILKFSIQGSFLDSKDASDNEKLLNAWEIGADVSLELPRFIMPLNTESIVPKFMAPRTTFTVGTSLQKNIGLDKQKFTGIIDYTWESKKTTSHSLQLINIQFIKNLNSENYFDIYTSEYNDLEAIQNEYFPNETLNTQNAVNFIDTNIDATFESNHPIPFKVAKNIGARYDIITENTLVPSLVYQYTFNNSENYKDTDFSFFRARIASAGNLTSMLAAKTDEHNNKTLFKTPIAQYLRTDLEYKKFWNFSLENVLAFRTFLGVAVPYGNSSTIPFSRSYFIGGPNDLRAWKIYDLGPGTTLTGLEYNVGNLKLISSLEYRFKILNSIKGALFVDAGNIWDISDSEVLEPEAKFHGLSSLEDIAVGSGFGIRYDLSFILLRLDLGFKMYEPYLAPGERWLKHANFQHSVYNFGISYPF